MEPPPPPTLEDLYDEDILARIDRQIGDGAAPWRPTGDLGPAPDEPLEAHPGPGASGGNHEASDPDAGRPGEEPPAAGVAGLTIGGGVVPRYPVARRLGVGGAMLAGAMFGLGEVLEPDRARQHIIDYVPDDVDESRQPVTFHHVVGDPRASRLVLRPWLLARLRHARAAGSGQPGRP